MAEPGAVPFEPELSAISANRRAVGGAAHPAHPAPRLLVFDLDGTLIDSLPTIVEAVHAVRGRHGAAPFPEAAVREAIGDGSRVLSGRVFADLAARGPHAIEILHREFIEEYRRLTERDRDVWRPGARELLSRARALGCTLAILSNKPLEFVERILADAGVRALFASVRGPENSAAAKPDPRSLLDIARECGAAAAETCFVGDSVVDFATGRAAGVATIGVRGGYRADGEPGPDLWLDDPAAVERWLVGRVGGRR